MAAESPLLFQDGGRLSRRPVLQARSATAHQVDTPARGRRITIHAPLQKRDDVCFSLSAQEHVHAQFNGS